MTDTTDVNAFIENLTPEEKKRLAEELTKQKPQPKELKRTTALATYNYFCITCGYAWGHFKRHSAVGVGIDYDTTKPVVVNTKTAYCRKCRERLPMLSKEELVDKVITLGRTMLIGQYAYEAYSKDKEQKQKRRGKW